MAQLRPFFPRRTKLKKEGGGEEEDCRRRRRQVECTDNFPISNEGNPVGWGYVQSLCTMHKA